MIWSNTNWIVAFMQHFLIRRKPYAKCYFIGNAMSLRLAASDACLSVSSRSFRPAPFPTLASFNNMRQEAMNGRFIQLRALHGFVLARLTTVLRSVALARSYFVCGAAVLAGACYSFASQGVNLLRLGLALVRPVRMRQHSFGPTCILA